MFKKVCAAIHEQHPEAQILPAFGFSWGEGLNQMMPFAEGAYISCCCDDTVPVPGWFDAGRAMLDSGSMPASRYWNGDGSPVHPVDEMPHGEPLGWCRSFLLTPKIYEAVGPFINATWYADWDYSERLIAAGIPIHACDGFSFIHLDGSREWLTPEEDSRQRREYEASHVRQGIA
jgi:GT2 family glycosyltransferase